MCCTGHWAVDSEAVLILWLACFCNPAWLPMMTQDTPELHLALDCTQAAPADFDTGEASAQHNAILKSAALTGSTRFVSHFFCSFLGDRWCMLQRGLTALHNSAQFHAGLCLSSVETVGFGLHFLEPSLHGLCSGSYLQCRA